MHPSRMMPVRGESLPDTLSLATASARRLSRRALFVCAGWAALTAVALAAEEGKILYPSSSSGAAAPAPAVGGGYGGATLIVGLLLAAAGAWLLWRNRHASIRATTGQKLAIEETRSLGNRQYLVVASYADKKLLLGVCQGRIDLIAPLHDEKPRA